MNRTFGGGKKKKKFHFERDEGVQENSLVNRRRWNSFENYRRAERDSVPFSAQLIK